MMGAFRLIKDDQVVFYEIMVLVNESEGTALKVKHFTPGFVSWEQKEDSIVFRLAELTGQRAVFKGLVIERPDADHLAITIRFKRTDGRVENNLLQLRRYEPR